MDGVVPLDVAHTCPGGEYDTRQPQPQPFDRQLRHVCRSVWDAVIDLSHRGDDQRIISDQSDIHGHRRRAQRVPVFDRGNCAGGISGCAQLRKCGGFGLESGRSDCFAR